MPYITQEARVRLLKTNKPESVGELNYLITTLCAEYIHEQGIGYSVINDVMGVLSAAQQEFYQRIAAPYEYKKRDENGDVYDRVP